MAEEPIFQARLNATHAENREAFLQFLAANGREADMVTFIIEVKELTQGRLRRHRWIDVARRYAPLEWIP